MPDEPKPKEPLSRLQPKPPLFQLLPKGRKAWIRAGAVVLVPLVLLLIAGWFMSAMPGKSHSGSLPALTAEQAALSGRLRAHVVKLAGEIGERNAFRPGTLARASGYIAEQFRAAGLQPVPQNFRASGQEFTNLIVELPGSSPEAGVVVVGAHYDSAVDCPAANDNATGVAALLELARTFAGRKPRCTLRFAAFANEEPPFFQTEEMGSMVYARSLAAHGEKLSAMVALETLGCYSDQPGSQQYPPLVGLAYPDRGNFVAFVGNLASRGLTRKCVAAFRTRAEFPSEGACLPGWIPGIGWSDHWSFWQAGYGGIMVTDTAPFRYAHYHQPTDTPDKVDFDRLARVTAGLAGVAEELSGAAAPAGR